MIRDEGMCLFFFFLWMVTFSKRMESRGKTEGEMGVLSEKMSSDFCNDGSEKEGQSTGLRGCDVTRGIDGLRGGKSDSEKRGGSGSSTGSGGVVARALWGDISGLGSPREGDGVE